MIKHLSLFTGVGMLDLAVEYVGGETVATAEIDKWSRDLTRKRYPNAVHFEDVHDVTKEALAVRHDPVTKKPLPAPINLVTGGFPCQDLSVAGYGKGLAGKRSGIWREIKRILGDFKPRYVLVENVAALRSRGLGALLNDLHYLGYSVSWDCIPAAAVGAPHMRDRLWISARRASFDDEATGKRIGKIGPAEDGVLDAQRQAVETMPRSGEMVGGVVYEHPPLATQRASKAAMRDGEALFPSPSAQEPGWKNIPIEDRDGNPPAHPNQRFYHGETGRVVQKGLEQIARMFPHTTPYSHVLLPTPTKSDGTGGPGTSPKRTGGKNLRTVADETSGGSLNPDWVEWLMGLPKGWTNPDVENDDLVPFEGWQTEPNGFPRTVDKAPHRRKRLVALGNGLVPQVAYYCLVKLLGENN